MKYWSQLEVEKILEYLYDRQVARVSPDEVESNGPIQETRELMMRLQLDNYELLNIELGNRENKRRI